MSLAGWVVGVVGLRRRSRSRRTAAQPLIHAKYGQSIEGTRHPIVAIYFQRHSDARRGEITVAIAGDAGFEPLVAAARQHFGRYAQVRPAANRGSITITGWKKEHEPDLRSAVPLFQQKAGVRS